MDSYYETLLGILGTFFVVFIAIIVLLIIAQWKIFTKAGEAGWKSIIPIYNIAILYKIVGINPWFVLLTIFGGIIPIIGTFIPLVMSIWCSVKLSKAFGHDIGFALGLIFLPNIFQLILGFGSSEYVGPQN